MNEPIFIVGAPRSGTTLLRLLLNNNSQISIPEETWYFTDLDKEKDKLLANDNWQYEISLKLFQHTRRHFPSLTFEEIHDFLKSTSRDNWPNIVATVNLIYLKQQNKKRWGDKTPGYVTELPLIKKLFPDAKIIHIIRDPRDVIPSIINFEEVGPKNKEFKYIVNYYKTVVSKGRADGRFYFQNNYLEVNYESLLKDPDKFLITICEFLNVPFEKEMLDFYKTSHQSVPGWDWHQKTKSPIDQTNIGKWKKKMNPSDITYIQLACKKIIKDIGFEIVPNTNLKMFLKYYFYITKLTFHQKKYQIKRFLYYKLKYKAVQ